MSRLSLICLSLLFCLAVGGCSVKEDREMCPCRLVLDLSDVDSEMADSLNVVVMSSDGLLHSDVIYNQTEKYVVEVPHDRLTVNVWMGDSDLCIPYGSECPMVYMHSFVADTYCEEFCQRIDLRKNHCCLTVKVEGYEQMPYSFTLYGNVDGYEMDGSPSMGSFSCVAYPSVEGGSQVMLPRQFDDSLMLEVDDGTSTVKIFALGEYLAAGGYDWKEEDLQDVTVILDYYVTYVKIVIQGWQDEHVYDIIL